MADNISKSQISNVEAKDAIDTAFVVATSEPMGPRSDERQLPLDQLYVDESANAVFTETGRDGSAERVELSWLEDDDMLDPDNGEAKCEKALRQKSVVELNYWVKKKAIPLKRISRPLEIQEAAQFAQNLPAKLSRRMRKEIWDRFLLGDTDTYGLAYDNQFFFDTDHPGRSDTGTILSQRNLFTGNLALNETNLLTVTGEMSVYRNEKGVLLDQEPIRVGSQMLNTDRNFVPSPGVEYHLYIGASNQAAAHALANVNQDNPGSFAGRITYDVVKEITMQGGNAANSWFVVRPGIYKPLNLIQEAPRFQDMEDLEADMHKWFYRAAFGFGYRQWAMMAYVKHT